MDNFLYDFEEDLKLVFKAVKTKLLSYPEDFKAQALMYLDRYKIFDEAFKGNHMCFLLPFWLKDTFGLTRETCRKMSEGFMFGLFYFIIQDQVMDALKFEYKGDLLPLGNLFLVDFIEEYRKLLPKDNMFWSYLKKYFGEWAYSVNWEQKDHQIQNKAYTKEDLILVAHKAAPLKLPAVAACILGGKEQEAEKLSRIIDHAVITFQLMDDFSDWREDQISGNCTYFLWEVLKYCGTNDFSQLNASHINKSIYSGKILYKILDIMYENHSIIKDTSEDYLHIIKYHESLLKSFENKVNNMYYKRNEILQGGFFNLL